MEIIENMETTVALSEGYVDSIPNTHIRDFQRKKVYDAEEKCAFWNSIDVLPLEEVQELIISISNWAGIKVPKLDTGDPKTKQDILTAYATKDSISLPFPIAKTVPMICHEMAHVINYQDISKADHHGQNFASVYLQIVREFSSPRNYLELRKAFDSSCVRYNSE